MVSRTFGVLQLSLATGALRGEGAPKVRRIRSPRSLPVAACTSKKNRKTDPMLVVFVFARLRMDEDFLLQT